MYLVSFYIKIGPPCARATFLSLYIHRSDCFGVGSVVWTTPACLLFVCVVGRSLISFCVYLLLFSQRKLGRMNSEFIPGRGVKPVRMDTPPSCRLIVFFCHIKQIKVRRLRRRQSATSRAAHYDSSAQFIKRLYFYEFWVAIFFNHKVLQLCILLCSQVLSCELLRRTLQGS